MPNGRGSLGINFDDINECSLDFHQGVETKMVGFPPQIIHFYRDFHDKSSILGYPYFGKHPIRGKRLREFFFKTYRIPGRGWDPKKSPDTTVNTVTKMFMALRRQNYTTFLIKSCVFATWKNQMNECFLFGAFNCALHSSSETGQISMRKCPVEPR